MKKLYLLIFTLLIFSCNDKAKDDNILARVYDKYLHASDLQGNVPQGLTGKDSLIAAKNYINNWVRQQLLIEQAERNLTEEQKDFRKQLDSYRNSLITYQYESLLIKQKLDTVVHDSIIRNYYEQNASNFELRDNILIANYVVLSADSSNAGEFRELLKSDEPEDLEMLQFKCEQSAVDCYLNREKWISMRELMQQLPIKTYDEENFLRSNPYTEIRDENLSLVYLLRIIDYRLAKDKPPLSYEKQRIRRIILNKRKTALVKQMEKQIFNSALESNEIEIF